MPTPVLGGAWRRVELRNGSPNRAEEGDLQGSVGGDRDGSRGRHGGDRVWREGKSPFARVK